MTRAALALPSVALLAAFVLVIATPARAQDVVDPAEPAPAKVEPAPAPPAPPVVVAPPAPAATPAPAPAPDAPTKGLFSTVGLLTMGGGALAAVGVGAMALLSPCACALPFACPVAAAGMGAGACVGGLIAKDGGFRRAWVPAVAGVAVGATAGTIAGVGALVGALAVDGTLPTPGANLGAATTGTLAAAGVAALVGGVVVLVGAVAAGFGASWAYELTEPAAVPALAPAPTTPRPRAPAPRPGVRPIAY